MIWPSLHSLLHIDLASSPDLLFPISFSNVMSLSNSQPLRALTLSSSPILNLCWLFGEKQSVINYHFWISIVHKNSLLSNLHFLNWRSSYLLPVILTGICLTHRVYLLGHRNPEPTRVNLSNWCLFVPGLCAHNLLNDDYFNSMHGKILWQPWIVVVGSIHGNHRHLEK